MRATAASKLQDAWVARLTGASVLGGGGLVMAFGERLGLVPASHEVGNPTSLFTDEKGGKR